MLYRNRRIPLRDIFFPSPHGGERLCPRAGRCLPSVNSVVPCLPGPNSYSWSISTMSRGGQLCCFQLSIKFRSFPLSSSLGTGPWLTTRQNPKSACQGATNLPRTQVLEVVSLGEPLPLDPSSELFLHFHMESSVVSQSGKSLGGTNS